MKPRSTAEALAQARRFEHSARAMSEQSPKTEHVDYKRWHERMGEDYSRAMQDIIKLQTERDRLAEQNRELREALEKIDQFYVFLDSWTPPELGKGARQVLNEARALLSKVKV